MKKNNKFNQAQRRDTQIVLLSSRDAKRREEK